MRSDERHYESDQCGGSNHLSLGKHHNSRGLAFRNGRSVRLPARLALARQSAANLGQQLAARLFNDSHRHLWATFELSPALPLRLTRR
jgi:hypothetical protein